jgi:hypothetical protein
MEGGLCRYVLYSFETFRKQQIIIMLAIDSNNGLHFSIKHFPKHGFDAIL